MIAGERNRSASGIFLPPAQNFLGGTIGTTVVDDDPFHGNGKRLRDGFEFCTKIGQAICCVPDGNERPKAGRSRGAAQ